MAKRGIDEHPKVIEFAELLGLPVCYAVGPLELFWHWVAKYRPDGDITGVKPTAIAHSIRFPESAQKLMDALIGSGLVDRDANGSLTVHDWSEHADNSVHQLLKKKGVCFADGNEPFTRNRARKPNDSQTVHEPFTNDSQTVHASRARHGHMRPEPEPEPEPVSLGEERSSDRFCPPSEEIVEDYMSQRGWIDPKNQSMAFVGFYKSKGWKVGKSPMKDWKAAVVTWEVKAKTEGRPVCGSNTRPDDEENERRAAYYRELAERG